MKEGAILIDCARSGIVDKVALSDALSSGRLYSAGLEARATYCPCL
jgi:phosphoglycerate dehydrogenase-like enzyme